MEVVVGSGGGGGGGVGEEEEEGLEVCVCGREGRRERGGGEVGGGEPYPCAYARSLEKSASPGHHSKNLRT